MPSRTTSVLDVGAGTRNLSVSAALAGPRHVTAVDVDKRALLNTRLNAALNGVDARAVRGDLMTPFVGCDDLDLVVSNPPYVPATDVVLPSRSLARCWDAGRAYLDRI